jgi:hypothetical protein
MAKIFLYNFFFVDFWALLNNNAYYDAFSIARLTWRATCHAVWRPSIGFADGADATLTVILMGARADAGA